MAKKKSMINENRFFSLISAFFAHPEKVLVEIAQNASRAKATKLDISISENSLTVYDNGQGAKDIKPLLCVADSNWDKDVEDQEMPAGWGNYYLIALSETITYRSLFGSITIDCPMFLKDSAYREGVFANVIPSDKKKGFTIEAVLLPGISKKLLPGIEGDWYFQEFYGKALGYFPMKITINGKCIDKLSLMDNIRACHIQTTYHGNHIGIDISEEILESPRSLLRGMSAVWYGIPINNMRWGSVYIDVTKGSPVTPVLPFRHDIKDDEKIGNLYEFVKNKVINYCVAILNDSTFKDKHLLLKASKILSMYGSQDNLNGVERFCVVAVEPYYNTEYCGDSSRRVIIADKRNPVVVSENISLYINDKEKSIDDLFLPEGAIVTVENPNRKPSWLSIENKDYELRVVTTSNSNNNYSGHYTWRRSIIICEGKDIKSLAVVYGAGDGTVYYSESPDKFYNLSDAVFAQKEYSEDGNDWASQEDYFNGEISEDIQNITGNYNIKDLLKGIYDVLGIWHSDVLSLNFDKNKKTLVIKTPNKEKVLKVA